MADAAVANVSGANQHKATSSEVVSEASLSENALLNGKYILVQKGKKNYFLIIVA